MSTARKAGAVVGFLTVAWKMLGDVIEEDGFIAGVAFVMMWLALMGFAISFPEPTLENEVLD